MPTLYIIDGYAQFFRAYHAIRTPMSSPVTKEPTNMTFGFVGMLLKLLRGQEKRMAESGGRPDYLVVTIDVSGDTETFRSGLYPEYKANRPEPPGDLFPQVGRCLQLLEAIGVPVLGAAGYEADDVIGTLVRTLRESHPDLRIRIVSKDKDLKQLLEGTGPSGRVGLYDVHTDLLIDEEHLRADTGLSPSQVVDMLALMGDAVDNVPGVPGVGDKTAALLLREYGSLDNLMARAGEIGGKRGENLRGAAAMLPLSRQLVTLRCDVPIGFNLEDASTDRLRLAELLPILRELGFNRYQEEVRGLLGDGGDSPGGGAPGPAVDHLRRRGGGGQEEPARTGGPPPPPGGLFDTAYAAEPVRAQSGRYHCVKRPEELRALVARMRDAEVVAVDTETTGLSPMRAALCGISIAVQPGEGFYIPVRSPDPGEHMDEATVVSILGPALSDPAVPKCGHNVKFDVLVLRRHGIELRGLAPSENARQRGSGTGGGTPWPGCDSMVASFLIDAARSGHGLDALSLALLKRTNIPISELIGSGREQKTFDRVPLGSATEYAAEDADVSLQLRSHMLPRLRALSMWDLWERVELPLVEVLAELEWNGILVDPAELDRQRSRLAGRIESLSKEITEHSRAAIGRTFNPDSPKQLAAALFNRPDAEEPGLGLRSAKKTKTGHSTDIEVLEKLAGDPDVGTPIPGLIVEYRQLTKLVGTYLVALKEEINPATGRIHTSFHQTGAATGRLASSDPNLQNIPIRSDIGREIRRAFIAPPGRVLISADYSQIELRILAHLSRDAALIQAFERDEDIHTAVAAQIAGVAPGEVTREQRAGAKMINFGIVYGITPYGLARRLKVPTARAEEIITGYKRRFAGITTFLEECIAQARRYGYVETILRRRRPVSGIDDRNPSVRAQAERIAINSVVQGSAADLIKVAMVDLHGRLSEHAYWGMHGGARAQDAEDAALREVRMLLQIHDELVFEAPEGVAEDARALIVERMENCMAFAVPIRVDSRIATNWFEGKQ
ncbi:MAG: DNA polymerase I [Phycisphaerales bacterium]|nr:DNA polymerase I [Phycisphaerales bacterium]